MSADRLALVAFITLGCGPKAADVQRARDSVYQTEYATVWNAVQAEMDESFRDIIKVRDADRGYIESYWKNVGASVESTEGVSTMEANNRSPAAARTMIRMMVRIEPGGPPWRITVEGEGALFRPGMSMLQPYERGSEEEPIWVQGRIDSMRMDIYDRLKQYAVAPPAARTP